ncbi:MAG TPA: hypothetical protein VI078_04765 [bacterium]
MAASAAYTEEMVRGLLARSGASQRPPERIRLIADTTDFFGVESDDVLVLDGTPYLIRNYEREGRFGLDDEPKYWVRRAIDLLDGSTRVLKFEFHEEFETRIGGVSIRRFRSPRKEARILDLVRGQRHFMQGRWALDGAGNNVRILEFIRGRRYDQVAVAAGDDHEDFFHRHFPAVLEDFVGLVRAIKFLHDRGEKHGDIRRDHIICDRDSGVNRWIDFDYDYVHGESLFSFDLQGLGNILIFLAGRGDVLLPELRREQPAVHARLTRDDLSIAFNHRVANLQKVFPYVPDSLNRVLLHFSEGAGLFYDAADQLLEDLAAAQADVTAATGRRT